MEKGERVEVASEIMLEFAGSTGLDNDQPAPRRYLWTDAFAVCSFLELYRTSQDEKWLELTGRLIDQVHHVLGRHRQDSGKSGWISGLSEEEGERHPTRGGLRIGKKMPERAPKEPPDERLEWERDGQYYHYLTKWMHALLCASRVTGEGRYLRWGMELAQRVHAAFRHTPTPEGALGLHWKMSVDLERPLVRSVGQHDPLDGLVTLSALQSAAKESSEAGLPDLSGEIQELASMCGGREWATEDPLGIGSLLWDMNRIEQVMFRGDFHNLRLFQKVVDDGLASLQAIGGSFMDLPARYRLAFRELGLSIGLKGVARFARLVDQYPELHDREFLSWLQPRLEEFSWHIPLSAKVERFWMEERRKRTEQWKDHKDINAVMLATSLAPEVFLRS